MTCFAHVRYMRQGEGRGGGRSEGERVAGRACARAREAPILSGAEHVGATCAPEMLAAARRACA